MPCSSDRRLIAALRTTCRRLSEMFQLPSETINLDDVVGIEARFIEFNRLRGLSHTRAVQYEGTGFHAFRHAYNALIDQVGTDDPNKLKEVQMTLLRQGDKRTNDRYGKSAPPLRQRARQAHINVSDLAMGDSIF